MRVNGLLRTIFALACAATLWSCGGGGKSPSSPTVLTAAGSSATLHPLEEDAPAPDPVPPTSDPGPPTPGPTAPMPDPPPPQTVVTISIVGSSGNIAFTPNPIQASVGDMIAWTNSDGTTHRIVLDEGTVIGEVAPGKSTLPMALTSPSATYHCSIHPTMVGSINGALSLDPPPPPPPGYGDYGRRARK